MARIDYQGFVAVVKAAVTDAGGKITHNDLIEKIDAGGAGHFSDQLVKVVQSGALIASVKVQPDGGKPILTYSLPVEV